MPDQALHNLLSTKMFRPPLPADCVHRLELLHLLETGRSRPLTLISAPAGYGKSVLASSWLEASDWNSVWLSLDEEDSNLQRFLGYLTAAVCERFPEALETARTLSQASQFPGTEAVAAVVSNELNAINQPFFLVLDDYHHIHASSAVNEIVRILLEHPPLPLHLVILTRRDPPLPLGRLRGLGQVTEVRMQDLRFSASETQDLLVHAADIRPSEDAIANIDREIEGWAAGLRLITLALRTTENADRFLQNFHGGTQQMQQYLIAEVMAGLPKPLRRWMLRSALLDRFCAPLCEAVCMPANAEQSDTLTGEAFLEHMQFANLFLVPLDGYGRWFRFHHLFQNLLKLEASRQLDEAAIAALHMAASTWFESNGFIEDAIRAALKGGDPDCAAGILDRHRLEELEKLNWPIVDRWLEVLGPHTGGRPGLQLAAAFVAVRRFDVPRLAAILEEAAPLIENNPTHAHLLGELRCLQGILSYRLGEGEISHTLLQEARQRFEATDKRGIAGFAVIHETLSLGLCGRGDEALAQNLDLENGAANADPLYHSLLLAGRIGLSYHQGDLTRAANEATRLQGIAEAGGAAFPLNLNLFFRIGSDLQRGEFEAALQLSDAVAQCRYAMPLRVAFSAIAALALCHQLLHRGGAASRVASDFLTLAQENSDADGLAAAHACEARIQLLQGDLDRASRWAGVDGEPPKFSDLFLSVEVPAMTRARIWIAQGTNESLRRAHRLMEATSWRARGWHLNAQVIEADVLNSLAIAGLGNLDEALDYLAETVMRAAPGGWLRPFLEQGQPMGDLLAELENHGLATDYSRHLQNRIQAWLSQRTEHARAEAGAKMALGNGLRESLTNRELVILELLGDRLQNKEIARELSVSPETVKTHLKHLFAKLGVNSRREAAAMSKAIVARGSETRRSAAE